MPVDWQISPNPVDYPDALAAMESRVDDIIAGRKPELIWLLQHPPLYTAGTSAQSGDLKDAERFPVFATGRGGRYTYHGPGQRVIYALVDLRARGRDLRAHVWRLEEWLIRVLADFGVTGERREGRVGIWVQAVATRLPLPLREGGGGWGGNARRDASGQSSLLLHPPTPYPLPQGEGEKVLSEQKIGAIGVRVRKWVAYHGLSLNIDPDLSHFSGIVPCGIADYGVTSLHKLGIKATMEEVDESFKRHLDILLDHLP